MFLLKGFSSFCDYIDTIFRCYTSYLRGIFLSTPSPFPLPFLSSGCLFGLGVGLTGVASSVSPTAPDGLGFGFSGSLGAGVALALGAGILGDSEI